MQAILNAVYGSPDFQNLVDRYYRDARVQGFALGVDPAYVALLNGQMPGMPLNDALEKRIEPAGWKEHCAARHLPNLYGMPPTPSVTSPIQVFMYITDNVHEFRQSERVPFALNDGFEVIIEHRGPFVGAADYRVHRPLIGGICVGNAGKTTGSGTLGGFLKRSGTSQPEMLSCHHVLVDPFNKNVMQRSPDHSGVFPAEVVGKVTHAVPLAPSTLFTYADPYYRVDACLAEVGGNPASSAIRMISVPPTSITKMPSIAPGDPVEFVGKESDLQTGFIVRIVAREKVNIGGADYNFGDFIEIGTSRSTLAARGDSGSWILRNMSPTCNELCGMLFAIDVKHPDRASCCVMDFVIEELRNMTGHTYVLY